MSAATGRGASSATRFALTKFRPPTLPATLVTRSALHDRLTAGSNQQLTVVVGSAGAGKSVLLASWAATRPPGTTSWLACDKADAHPLRFWSGFVESIRRLEPGLCAEAGNLMAMDGVVSANLTASIANDAAKLPAGSAIIVDDFHHVAPAVAKGMADLAERWPARAAQFVLSSHFDPTLRLHRLRMSDELCELRDRDLYFSLAESRDLLANFGVDAAAADLALLHRRSEGWPAALQMAALALRAASDPARAARALEAHRHGIAGYFISEVLDKQPPEVAQFMLDISVLGELTAEACAAITERQDAAALLRGVHVANLFTVALDDERTSFRYHRLVRQVLRAELRARDRVREQALQLRAAEWFESVGETRRAARHFLKARRANRALALLQDRVVADYLCDPAVPAPIDPSPVDSAALRDAPVRLLALAADLLLMGEPVRGGEYLDMFEDAHRQIQPGSELAARLAATRAVRHMQAGQAEQVIAEALTARAIQRRIHLTDEWTALNAVLLMRGYTWLEDFQGVDREITAALTMPGLPEPVKLVFVPGAQALAWFESGRLAEAAKAAETADANAQRLGFSQHFFAVDYLRALAGVAFENREFGNAEQLTERTLSIAQHRRPALEFLTLLDRAEIWAARGLVQDALAIVQMAREVLAQTGSVLLARADELEGLIRLSLGDLRSPVALANGLPAPRRALLLARVALASGDHRGVRQCLQAASLAEATPRRALVRQILVAAAAIQHGDPAGPGLADQAVDAARHAGFLNTAVTTAPQITSYLIDHSTKQPSQLTGPFVAAALQARAAHPATSQFRRACVEPLTPAERRVLELLPTSTYPQMAARLYVSRNTVKTHLRSIYQKLGVASRAQAVQRAADLHLL